MTAKIGIAEHTARFGMHADELIFRFDTLQPSASAHAGCPRSRASVSSNRTRSCLCPRLALGLHRRALLLPATAARLAIGYLIGARMVSADAATNVGTLVQLESLFLSGLALPLWLMPHALGTVLSYLPTSFFANLMMLQMPGGRPYHSAWVSTVVVAVTAAVFVVLAIRTFRWDQGEAS